ncbi:DUF6705 family protein [Chryseobacterium taihuense]|uniref:DUF6705 domain-containing protein n=1 Tax=Chryseobacterium taihuense TaxID=1141221 RepID=A0ABY0R4L1_9FLAO|nr:DUF6705 family protein [Chryseobacterium taihuense]SDM38051.1 hypothetical protein SAMN05216273_12820 [Chryseobacterium taihuense]
MKNIITLFVALLAISCKSQIVSLEQAAQCRDTPNCSMNYDYAKDLNNTLNKYIGTWKGTYNGRVYEMKFNKSLYEDFIGTKSDEIKGRLRITTTGNLSLSIFDNFNEPDDTKTRFSGLGLTTDLQGYRMIFAGPVPEGCINHGTISLRIDLSTPNQMKVKYWSYNDIVVGDCPSTFSQTFPEQQEIFLTRQ